MWKVKVLSCNSVKEPLVSDSAGEAPDSEALNPKGGSRGAGRCLSGVTDGWGGNDSPASAGLIYRQVEWKHSDQERMWVEWALTNKHAIAR